MLRLTKLRAIAFAAAAASGVAVTALVTMSSGISQSVESGGVNRFPGIQVDNATTTNQVVLTHQVDYECAAYIKHTNFICAGTPASSGSGIGYVDGLGWQFFDSVYVNAAGTFGTTVTVGQASADKAYIGGGAGSVGLVAIGDDTNVNLTLSAKGTGAVNITGGSIALTGSVTGTQAEWTFPVVVISGALGTGIVSQVTATNMGTFSSAKYVTQLVGVGAGNFVLKLCGDGAICDSGSTFAVCTAACTSTASTVTACSAGAATTWPAHTTLSWVVTTACATDPLGNGIADLINN